MATSAETASALALLRAAVDQTARAGDAHDALSVLAGLQAVQDAAAAALPVAVRDARRHGLAWRWIGKALRISAQGAQQRYPDPPARQQVHGEDPTWAQARAYGTAVIVEEHQAHRQAVGEERVPSLLDSSTPEHYAAPPPTPPGRPDLQPPTSLVSVPAELQAARALYGDEGWAHVPGAALPPPPPPKPPRGRREREWVAYGPAPTHEELDRIATEAQARLDSGIYDSATQAAAQADRGA